MPVEKLDVAREFTAASTIEGEVWDGFSASGRKELGEPWPGRIRFYKVPEITAQGATMIRGRETWIQTAKRPDKVFPEMRGTLSKQQRTKGRRFAEDIQRARDVRE